MYRIRSYKTYFKLLLLLFQTTPWRYPRFPSVDVNKNKLIFQQLSITTNNNYQIKRNNNQSTLPEPIRQAISLTGSLRQVGNYTDALFCLQ
jgi:hypothetical protein